jgi:hypothetical protein
MAILGQVLGILDKPDMPTCGPPAHPRAWPQQAPSQIQVILNNYWLVKPSQKYDSCQPIIPLVWLKHYSKYLKNQQD